MTIRISTARNRAHAHAEYEERTMADARRRCRIAVLTPVIDPATFAGLLRHDTAAAAAALVRMNDWQREVQARAHAAWLNEAYGLTGDDLMTTEVVLANFERGMTQYQRETNQIMTTNETHTHTDQRTVCAVPVTFIEEEAQRRVNLLTAAAHREQQDEARHAQRRLRAVNKAVLYALEGAVVRHTLGDYLIASATRTTVVHRVSHQYGCSCEAGAKNQPCWHAELADILAAGRAAQEQEQEQAA